MVIASTPLLSPQGIAFDAVGRHAIQADPLFRKGNYYGGENPDQGLSIARMLAHITYLSDESMQAKFGRALRRAEKYSYDFSSEFAVETYLDYQGEQFVNRFDANTYLYITKAINYFDLTAAYDSLDKAMACVQCKMLVLSYSSDWLFPPYQSREIVSAHQRQGKDVTNANIESNYGHDAFLLEVDVMREFVTGFLEYALPHQQCCYPGCDGPACGRKGGHVEDETAAAPSARQDSIYSGRRVDYDLIIDLIEPESRVLDVGCGDGELLCQLIGQKAVRGTGLELRQDRVSRCVGRGIPVIQANVDEGLGYFPDDSYDYAILSMTLQVIERPDVALREMMRVAKKCIISIPNFGFWKVRLDLLVTGRAPVTRSLPYTWDRTPNRHVLSIKDFRAFCREYDGRIEQEIPLSSRGTTWWANRWPNLFADEAVYVVTAGQGDA
jgi:homoserine O-acetyltransferase